VRERERESQTVVSAEARECGAARREKDVGLWGDSINLLHF
jgi:hypothetical protein